MEGEKRESREGENGERGERRERERRVKLRESNVSKVLSLIEWKRIYVYVRQCYASEHV